MRCAEAVLAIAPLFAVGLAANTSGAAESACPSTPEVEAAEKWRVGDAIPPRLFFFKDSPENWWEGQLDCDDSEAVIGGLGNYPFLLALATDPRAHECVVDLAVARALQLRGPTTVLADLSAAYRRSPVLLKTAAYWSLEGRMRQRYVWVSGLEVDPRVLGEPRSSELVAEIAARLREGAPCARTSEEYRQRFRTGRDSGPWIWYLGTFVVPDVRANKQWARYSPVPESHIWRLLGAVAGDVLVLTRTDRSLRRTDRGRYVAEPYTVLWQVHEVYVPGPSQE
jgi:hypothetical protein